MSKKQFDQVDLSKTITMTKTGFVISRPLCVICGEPPFGDEYCCGHSQTEEKK